MGDNDFRTHVRAALTKADGVRVAKAPPPPPNKGGAQQQGGQMPPGAEGMPMGDPNGPSNRQIPEDHKFDPKALKPLAKMLWAMSVSLGHALQAYRLFNRVKSSTVSPDGMMGGRGYIMKVTELRQKLYDACEALSAVSDTVHDEVNAPHWKPKIGELTKEDFVSIERLIGESEKMLDNPEDDIEGEEEEVEKSGKPSSSWVKEMKGEEDGKPRSDLPDGGDAETVQKAKTPDHSKKTKQSSYDHRPLAERIAAQIVHDIFANSSVNPDSLGGPRVKHLDRADTDQTGWGGAVNPREPTPPKDDWGKDEGVSGEPMSQDRGSQPSYQIDGGRNAAPQQAPMGTSAMPDSNTSFDTRTEAYDFGIGRGNGNDAHGQGAGGYGEASPSMGDKGVYGPESGLPNDPGGKTHDNENPGTNSVVEKGVNKTVKQALQPVRAYLRSLRFWGEQTWSASSQTFESPFPEISKKLAWQPTPSLTSLPGDEEQGVARSDYYTGPKDNDENTIKGPTENPVMSGDVAESELPQSSPPSPPRPLIPRPSHFGEFEFATTQLPGDGGSATTEFDKDEQPGSAYRYEHMDQPYTKWDDSTHNMQPDWMSQRDNEGPYAKPNGTAEDENVVPK